MHLKCRLQNVDHFISASLIVLFAIVKQLGIGDLEFSFVNRQFYSYPWKLFERSIDHCEK